MSHEPFTAISSAQELEEYGVPAPKIRDKVLPVLDDVHRGGTLPPRWSSSPRPRPTAWCDVSPRGTDRASCLDQSAAGGATASPR